MALSETEQQEIQDEVEGDAELLGFVGTYRAQLLENVVISDEDAEIALEDTRSEDWSDDLKAEYTTIGTDTPDTFRAAMQSTVKSPCLSSDNQGGASGGDGGAGGAGGGGQGDTGGGQGGGQGDTGGGQGGGQGDTGGGQGGGQGGGPTYNTAGPGWKDVKTLEVSQNGLKKLEQFEGKRSSVYDDATRKPITSYESVKGYATIGIGHLIGAKERDKFRPYISPGKMTDEQIYALKRSDVPRFTGVYKKNIKQPITQNMFDAIVSLAFNTGPGHKTVKKIIELINAKNYNGAADALRNGPQTSKGKKLGGLVKRRNAEADLFLQDIPKG